MKRLTILFFLVGFSFFTRGQNLYVGVKSGGHVGSAFIDHSITNFTMREGFEPGFHGGVLFKFLPAPRNVFLKSGLQFSVNYVQKGWSQVFLTNEPKYKARMNYIEVPIEGVGYFGRKNKYFVAAGFYMEFLQSYSLADDPDDTNLGGQDFVTYIPSRDNEVGYGVRASGGVFRDFSFGQLHLEGFFAYTISNFINPGSLLGDIPDISNLWTTGVSLGYLFSLNGKNR